MIRKAKIEDAQAVCDIYNHYVLHTIITFEEIPLLQNEMEERIVNTIKAYPWFVYVEQNKILGYAYASQWKARSAYRNTIESGIYIDPKHTGQGIGSLLYKELLIILKEKKFHAVLGGIALPNQHSIALHEKLGFQKVGELKQVGFKFEKWIDVGYWEKLLNG